MISAISGLISRFRSLVRRSDSVIARRLDDDPRELDLSPDGADTDGEPDGYYDYGIGDGLDDHGDDFEMPGEGEHDHP